MKSNHIVPILGLIAAMSLMLAIVYLSMQAHLDQYLNPSPEKTAEQFINALGAHRYTGARNVLTEDLKQQATPHVLQMIVAAIEQGQGGVEQANGQSSSELGDHAVAVVQVKLGSGAEETVEISLQKENGIWKVAEIESLWKLVYARMQIQVLSL